MGKPGRPPKPIDEWESIFLGVHDYRVKNKLSIDKACQKLDAEVYGYKDWQRLRYGYKRAIDKLIEAYDLDIAKPDRERVIDFGDERPFPFEETIKLLIMLAMVERKKLEIGETAFDKEFD